MIIGVLKETKKGENRVALTPSGTSKLVKDGHTVLVEPGAGVRSSFQDIEYKKAGATLASRKDIAERGNLIVKVKEPLPEEYELLKYLKGKILFAYLHLSGSPRSLTERLLKYKITAIAYETIEDKSRKRILLRPMSEIAGIAAIQYATQFLQKKYGGAGVTLGELDGLRPSRVIVIGGGVAGEYAARTALGIGAQVTVCEQNERRIAELKKIIDPSGLCFRNKISFVPSREPHLTEALTGAHAVIGTVSLPGAKSKHIVLREHVLKTAIGAVLVDVSIDQGGCIWGSRPTTHEKPTFEREKRIYCCVPNIPGQFPLQSTLALTSATLPYIKTLGDKGLIDALVRDEGFRKGLHTWDGRITNAAVARDLNMKDSYIDPCDAIEHMIRERIV